MTRIGDLGTVVTGNTPKTSDPDNYSSKDILFVKPSDLSEDELVRIESSEYYLSEYARNKARILPPESIMVTCIGIIGKIGINKIECAFNQQINAIIPDRDKCIPEYIAFALLQKKQQIQEIANAPVVPIINKSQFSDIEIHVPSIREQEGAVKVLRKIEDLIVARKLQLQTFDDLIKSRFVELFGDLKRNTKGWSLYSFKELSEIITDGEHATPKRTTEGIYLLSARNVLNHSIQLDDVDYINQGEYDRISRRIVPQEGDILISCSGSVGRCCSVPPGLIFQMVRSIALVRFKKEISPTFAEYMITSDFVQEQIGALKTASSQANLFQGKIGKLQGFVPPRELQNNFATFVSQATKSKFYHRKSLNLIRNLIPPTTRG